MPNLDVLLSHLDLSHPGLAAVRDNVASGDEGAALRALVEHLRTRRTPAYLFDESDIGEFQDTEIVAEADRIMAHEIFGYFVGEEVDWACNLSTCKCWNTIPTLPVWGLVGLGVLLVAGGGMVFGRRR